jgi:hypothetical protein
MEEFKYTIQSYLTGYYLTLGKKIGPELYLVSMKQEIDYNFSIWSTNQSIESFQSALSIRPTPGDDKIMVALCNLNGETNIDGIYVKQCVANDGTIINENVFEFIRKNPVENIYSIKCVTAGRLLSLKSEPTAIYLESDERPNNLDIDAEKFIITKFVK